MQDCSSTMGSGTLKSSQEVALPGIGWNTIEGREVSRDVRGVMRPNALVTDAEGSGRMVHAERGKVNFEVAGFSDVAQEKDG